MGRQAHLLRLALGRSADLPPDWEALSDQYERVEGTTNVPPHYRCVDPTNLVSYGKTFDEKGRPMDMRVHELDAERCKAQNDVLARGVLQDGEDEDGEDTTNLTVTNIELAAALATEEESDSTWLTKEALGYGFWVACYALTYPILTLRRRIYVYNASESLSLVHFLRSEIKCHGIITSMFAGYPSAFLESFLQTTLQSPSSPIWLTRAIDKRLPGLLILTCDLLVFIPLSLFSKLQQLYLVPSSHLLPPASAFLPWSSSSPLIDRHKQFWYPSAVVSTLIFHRITDEVIMFIGKSLYRCAQMPKELLVDNDDVRPGFGKTVYLGVDSLFNNLGWYQSREPFPGDVLMTVPIRAPLGMLTHILNNLITLPAQAIVSRIIAHRFLEHASTPIQRDNAEWVKNRMFPILGPGLKSLSTLNGAKGIGRYVANVALCTGIYIALELCQQVIRNAITIWFIKRRESKAGRLRNG